MLPKAILFDIGDTIVPSTRIRSCALAESSVRLTERGLIPDASAFSAAYNQVDRAYHEPHLNHLYSDLRIIRRVLASYPVSNLNGTEASFLNEYRSAIRAQLLPNPELRDLFVRMRADGHVLGIVSDGSTEGQQETLWRLGVLDCFDVVVISEDIGVEKPDPAIFLEAIRGLAVTPSDALMVGDSLDRDIRGAKALGLKTAFINLYAPPSTDLVEADYMLTSLSELME